MKCMKQYFLKIPYNMINEKLTDHAERRMEFYGINIDQIRDALESEDNKILKLEYKEQQQRYIASIKRKNLTLNVIFCVKSRKITQIITSYYTEFPYNIGTGRIWLLGGFTKGEENLEKTKIKEEEKLKEAIIKHFLNPQVFIPPFIYKFLLNEAGLSTETLLISLKIKNTDYDHIIDIVEKNKGTPTKEFEKKFKELVIKQLFNKDVIIPIRESNQRQHLIKFAFDEDKNDWQVYTRTR